ncbi:MAG: hypothetical protein ACR2KG_10705 [Nocardioidaceae bacterium]
MNDDWRVTATLDSDSHGPRLLRALQDQHLESEVRARLGSQIAASADGPTVFLYAATEPAAREAERVLVDVLAEHNLTAQRAVHRWHPVEETWEDPDVAMPRTEVDQASEHQRLMAQQTAESQASGYAEWEVRVDLGSHRDAVSLAERLTAEGRSVVRRWKFLVVGANNEDEAHALAETISNETPPGASVRVEPGGGVGWQDGMPGTPFAIFAPLGG